jgi:hypothetical protein
MKANDVKHHISQRQPNLMILKEPERELKTWGVLDSKIHVVKAMFSSRV